MRSRPGLRILSKSPLIQSMVSCDSAEVACAIIREAGRTDLSGTSKSNYNMNSQRTRIAGDAIVQQPAPASPVDGSSPGLRGGVDVVPHQDGDGNAPALSSASVFGHGHCRHRALAHHAARRGHVHGQLLQRGGVRGVLVQLRAPGARDGCYKHDCDLGRDRRDQI